MSCLMATSMMVTLWGVLWQVSGPGWVICVSRERDERVILGTSGEGGQGGPAGTGQKWGWYTLCPHRLLCPPAAKHPEDVCGPTQFRCVSTNECIAASYHCDKESDCSDRSDEIGCSEQGAGGREGGPGLVSAGPSL